jgi:hypothetical protein
VPGVRGRVRVFRARRGCRAARAGRGRGRGGLGLFRFQNSERFLGLTTPIFCYFFRCSFGQRWRVRLLEQRGGHASIVDLPVLCTRWAWDIVTG